MTKTSSESRDLVRSDRRFDGQNDRRTVAINSHRRSSGLDRWFGDEEDPRENGSEKSVARSNGQRTTDRCLDFLGQIENDTSFLERVSNGWWRVLDFRVRPGNEAPEPQERHTSASLVFRTHQKNTGLRKQSLPTDTRLYGVRTRTKSSLDVNLRTLPNGKSPVLTDCTPRHHQSRYFIRTPRRPCGHGNSDIRCDRVIVFGETSSTRSAVCVPRGNHNVRLRSCWTIIFSITDWQPFPLTHSTSLDSARWNVCRSNVI